MSLVKHVVAIQVLLLPELSPDGLPDLAAHSQVRIKLPDNCHNRH